jgi:hypothetical protein
MNKMITSISDYDGIGLSEIEGKNLLERIDRKYIIKVADVDIILSNALEYYNVLEINGQRNMPYETVYYDKPGYDFYHHARLKRPNRFKIRYRKYKINDLEYFEIKQKVRGTSTLKYRTTLDQAIDPTQQISAFLETHNLKVGDYNTTLKVDYNRICLVSKTENERITIDTNLRITDFTNEMSFDGMAIVEVKSNKIYSKNNITNTLKELGYQAISCSKYCIGLAFVNPSLSKSGFAPQLRTIREILN